MNAPTLRLARSILLALLASACGGEKKDAGKGDPTAGSGAKPAASPSGAGPVVISVGPNGQTKVDGGDVKGDPKTCAAMNACCGASSDVSLFCGLSKATDGATCQSVLTSTQQYLAERKIAKPAGCP